MGFQEEVIKRLDDMQDKIKDIHKMARETRLRMHEYIDEMKK